MGRACRAESPGLAPTISQRADNLQSASQLGLIAGYVVSHHSAKRSNRLLGLREGCRYSLACFPGHIREAIPHCMGNRFDRLREDFESIDTGDKTVLDVRFLRSVKTESQHCAPSLSLRHSPSSFCSPSIVILTARETAFVCTGPSSRDLTNRASKYRNRIHQAQGTGLPGTDVVQDMCKKRSVLFHCLPPTHHELVQLWHNRVARAPTQGLHRCRGLNISGYVDGAFPGSVPPNVYA